jgi:hypothetical protein
VKRWFLVVLLLLPVQRSYSQGLWEDVGGVLGSACQITQGTGGIVIPGVGSIPIGDIPNLDWVCSLRRIHAFVDMAILRGDWGEFAREVAGQWIADFANYAAGEMGLGNFNGWANSAEDALKEDYKTFRTSLLRAMREALEGEPQDANPFGLPVTVAGGLAANYRQQNPLLALGSEMGRQAEMGETFSLLSRSYRVIKSEIESQQAIEASLGSALQNATKIIGTAGIPGLAEALPGQADSLSDKARTALSTREVAQIQVEALSTMLKSDASFQTALISTVSEVAKQQVLTNAQLSELIAQTAEGLAQQADLLQSELERLAQENLDAATELVRSGRNNTFSAEYLFSPDEAQNFAWGAP